MVDAKLEKECVVSLGPVVIFLKRCAEYFSEQTRNG